MDLIGEIADAFDVHYEGPQCQIPLHFLFIIISIDIIINCHMSHISPIKLFVDKVAKNSGLSEPLDTLYKDNKTVVFKVVNLKDQKPYAIKIVNYKDQNEMWNLQNQYILSSKWQHPNIIKIVEAEVDMKNQLIAIIMEYMEKDLSAHLDNEKAGSLKDKLELMNEIMSGMCQIHRSHIIHRDIKPQNIMLNGSKPVIIDFGQSKLTVGNTQTAGKGTDAYMAPEVRAEKKLQQGYDKKADIFSLGIVFIQILFHLSTTDFFINVAGQNFQKKKDTTVGFFIKEKKIEMTSDQQKIYQNVWSIIFQMIQSDPQKRLQSEKVKLLIQREIKNLKDIFSPKKEDAFKQQQEAFRQQQEALRQQQEALRQQQEALRQQQEALRKQKETLGQQQAPKQKQSENGAKEIMLVNQLSEKSPHPMQQKPIEIAKKYPSQVADALGLIIAESKTITKLTLKIDFESSFFDTVWSVFDNTAFAASFDNIARIAKSLRQFTSLRTLEFFIRFPLSNHDSWLSFKSAIDSLPKLSSVTIVVDPSRKEASQKCLWSKDWIAVKDANKRVEFRKW